jgi:hypothetical protein
MFKYGVYSIVGIIAIFVVAFCYLLVPNPFKITDPYHPRFKPDNFRFEDYVVSTCAEKEIMAKLFPVGTDKSFVDRVLVNSGGAKASKNNNHKNEYNYYYVPRHWAAFFGDLTWNMSVTYNDDGKVTDIRTNNESVYKFFEDCKLGLDYGRNWK